MRKPLPINEVLGVLPQVLVGLSCLCELRVHELVFSGERLDVLRKLAALGGLRLRELGLLLQLLPQQCDLLPQRLDLGLAVGQTPLDGVLLAGNDADVVLHIGEVP